MLSYTICLILKLLHGVNLLEVEISLVMQSFMDGG